ncbi:putative nucleotidyltransferase/HEPN domain-containing protein [Sphingomonas zeicaulis]|uniref:HEPN domain-containing protein n=1 Tax=Sphingomonas zeicaulis TaxID=1632740 RepID=UPI003D1EA9E3
MIRRSYDRAARAEGALAKARFKDDTGHMRSSLDHLPSGKRLELTFVVDMLRATFGLTKSGKRASAKREDAILKIVLFGSYARGDWVEDPIGRYFSDYDLLVVVADEKHTDVWEYWEVAEQRLLDELAAGIRLRTPVNFIVHSLEDVNSQLERGRPFFRDIVRDGIALFEIPERPFSTPGDLPIETIFEEAKAHFNDLIPSAANRMRVASYCMSQGMNNEAAFDLHQATEYLYNGMILVKTLYTPKTHNLVRLRNLAEQTEPTLKSIWPVETKFHKRCFELIRAACVKARYSRHYRINDDELEWIIERVGRLLTEVTERCEIHLRSLED